MLQSQQFSLHDMTLEQLFDIVERATALFSSEPTVLDVSGPVAIVGDIHGQFCDLLELFRVTAPPPHYNFLFLGDYVDRGYYSLECIMFILKLKLDFPRQVFILRGNHESRAATQQYGFYDECVRKCGATLYEKLMRCFDMLPLAAVVSKHIFAVHAGISPLMPEIASLRTERRGADIPSAGAVADLLWSDPAEANPESKFDMSPRGCGVLYGAIAVRDFCKRNGITTIIRAHQMQLEGFSQIFDGQLATVFSAPNYAFRAGNAAAVVEVDEQGGMEVKRYMQRGRRDFAK